MVNAWIVGILGIWMVIAPFVRMTPMGQGWNDWMVGVVVAIFAFSMSADRRGEGVTAGIFAVWLFIAGFIPGAREGVALYWNDIIVGIVMLIAGFAATRRAIPARPPV